MTAPTTPAEALAQFHQPRPADHRLLHCPVCTSPSLTTIEEILGTGHPDGIYATPDGGVDIDWADGGWDADGNAETAGVSCPCGWSHIGPDWQSKLLIEVKPLHTHEEPNAPMTRLRPANGQIPIRSDDVSRDGLWTYRWDPEAEHGARAAVTHVPSGAQHRFVDFGVARRWTACWTSLPAPPPGPCPDHPATVLAADVNKAIAPFTLDEMPAVIQGFAELWNDNARTYEDLDDEETAPKVALAERALAYVTGLPSGPEGLDRS